MTIMITRMITWIAINPQARATGCWRARVSGRVSKYGAFMATSLMLTSLAATASRMFFFFVCVWCFVGRKSDADLLCRVCVCVCVCLCSLSLSLFRSLSLSRSVSLSCSLSLACVCVRARSQVRATHGQRVQQRGAVCVHWPRSPLVVGACRHEAHSS